MNTSATRRFRDHLPSWLFVVVAFALTALLAAAFVLLGVYDVAGDRQHTRPVYAVLETLRQRSIAVRAEGIKPPADLDTPARVQSGGSLYAEMCVGCHLGPGLEPSELSQGLYPAAPVLAKATRPADPATAFWVVKHGVKMSAMPAWGKTHNDQLLWDVVAFLRKMPNMTPAQYQQLTTSEEGGHDAAMQDMDMDRQ